MPPRTGLRESRRGCSRRGGGTPNFPQSCPLRLWEKRPLSAVTSPATRWGWLSGHSDMRTLSLKGGPAQGDGEHVTEQRSSGDCVLTPRLRSFLPEKSRTRLMIAACFSLKASAFLFETNTRKAQERYHHLKRQQ